jgi:hypothetical protein
MHYVKFISPKSLVFGLIFYISLIFSTNAASLKAGYGACVSEDLFNQYIQAIIRNDELGMQYLYKNGCIKIVDNNYPLSIIDQPSTGAVKVRVYVDDSSAILWTFIEAIKN